METTKLLRSDFLDILFDDRNKEYGAYDLRRRYDKRVRNAVMGMTGVVLLIITGYTVSSRLMASDEVNVTVKPVIVETRLEKIVEEKKVFTPPPTIHRPAPAVSKPTIQHVVFRIEKDENVQPHEEPVKNDALIDKAIGFKTDANGDPNGSDNGVPDGIKAGSDVIEAPKVEKRDEPFIFVEIMPEFPGGEEALRKFLMNNVRYPGAAVENGIEGMVLVKFVVQANGEIANVELAGAKKGAGLDDEAIRVVKKMPKWKPGRQGGRNVPVYFNLPINFKLDNQ